MQTERCATCASCSAGIGHIGSQACSTLKKSLNFCLKFFTAIEKFSKLLLKSIEFMHLLTSQFLLSSVENAYTHTNFHYIIRNSVSINMRVHLCYLVNSNKPGLNNLVKRHRLSSTHTVNHKFGSQDCLNFTVQPFERRKTTLIYTVM